MKKKVIDYFLKKPIAVSMEDICKDLKLSMDEVETAIMFWNDYGYNISQVPYSGYQISLPKKSWGIDDVRVSNVWLGKELVYLPQCSSTNNFALNFIDEQICNGLLIISNNQTAGRGRFDRKWLSSSGDSLTFSAVVTRKEDVEAPLYTFATAVSLAEMLENEFQIKAQIKWPNDVLLFNKKICGILADYKISINKQFVVLGVGINLNNSTKSLEELGLFNAISLYNVTQEKIDEKAFLKTFLSYWEKWLNVLESDTNKMLDKWMIYADIVNKIVCIEEEADIIKGTVIGVNNNGGLKIKNSNGVEVSINSGDLKICE